MMVMNHEVHTEKTEKKLRDEYRSDRQSDRSSLRVYRESDKSAYR